MKKIATGSLALIILLGGFALASAPSAEPEIDEAAVNAKVDQQLRLTMARLKARTTLARR